MSIIPPIATLAGITLILLPAMVFAHTPYTMKECAQFGQVVEAIGKGRDAGTPLAVEKEKALNAAIALLKQHSYVKDEEDALMTINAVGTAYSLTSMTPEAMGKMAYDECVKLLVPGIKINRSVE